MTGHVVLVGLMGAGKSTVGSALAERLGRPLVDGDAALEGAAGQVAAAVAAESGVAALHRLEARVLLDALARPEPAVVVAAASAIDDPSCRSALADPFVVWLDAPNAVLAERLGGGPHRRPLGDGGLEALRERREPAYASVADLRLSTAAAPVSATVAAIVAAVS